MLVIIASNVLHTSNYNFVVSKIFFLEYLQTEKLLVITWPKGNFSHPKLDFFHPKGNHPSKFQLTRSGYFEGETNIQTHTHTHTDWHPIALEDRGWKIKIVFSFIIQYSGLIYEPMLLYYCSVGATLLFTVTELLRYSRNNIFMI